MTSLTAPLTSRKINEFSEKRLSPVLSTAEAKVMEGYLAGLLAQGSLPPRRGRGVDIAAVARAAGFDTDRLKAVRGALRPIFQELFDTVSGNMVNKEVVPAAEPPLRKRRGAKPKAIIEFPEVLETTWAEPNEFGAALRLHARRHGESIYHLYNAVARPEDGVNRSTLISWGRGARMPRTVTSLEILGRIERRYRLPAG